MASKASEYLEYFIQLDNESTDEFINRLFDLDKELQEKIALTGESKKSLRYWIVMSLSPIDMEFNETRNQRRRNFESTLQQDLDDASPHQRSDHITANAVATIEYNDNFHENSRRYSRVQSSLFFE